ERTVRREQVTVLRGRCYEQESVPFKGVDGLIDSLSEHLGMLDEQEFMHLLPPAMASLARMFPVLRRLRLGAPHWKPVEQADPVELRRHALAALRELLTRLARRGPLILSLDDLQWGDDDSARLLGELVRGPTPPAVLWLVCCRSEDEADSPCLRELLDAAD